MASTLNLATLKTPGVYIDEMSLFPPSVVQVETAIPAFIGYTEKAEKEGKDFTGKALKIKSMVEYRRYFGSGPDRKITAQLSTMNAVDSIVVDPAWYLHDSLMLFFANGGEKCYIISVGNYKTIAADQTHFTNALDELKKHDEPTLIVIPDAMLLIDPNHIANVQQAAIDHCEKMQDRFAILDVKVNPTKEELQDSDITTFRGSVTKNLKYGAAYYPWLKTSLPFEVSFAGLSIEKGGLPKTLSELLDPGPSRSLWEEADVLANNSILDTQAIDAVSVPDAQAYQAAADNAAKKALTKAAIDAFQAIPNNTFKTNAVKKVFADYLTPGTPDGNALTALEQEADALDPATALEDVRAVFDKVVIIINAFKAKALLSLKTAEKELNERIQREIPQYALVVNAGKLAEDSKAVDKLLEESKTAYAAAANKVDQKTETLTAINNFIGVPNPFQVKNTDARTAYRKYIDQTTPSSAGQILKDLLVVVNALGTAAVGGSSTDAFDKAFNEVINYITGFGEDLDERLALLELEMRSKVPIYAAIVSAAQAQGIILPPGGAVAGIYAYVDENRGVWKAPANVGITNVVGPTVLITDEEQEDLNVDPDGKSINAIRFFTNKGTLVWGARTLTGNDNEWRYISVRRFFIMAEESIKKASMPFVFEPNDANTWVKMRAITENFLTLQWRAGALAGRKAEHAFYVRVGLGQTMTAEDILNGFMIVEIGMAVVRPAEFIVLRFAHKMQES